MPPTWPPWWRPPAGWETGSELVDLDAAFRQEGVGRLFADPAGDMIHPNEDGYDRVARLIYGALAGDRDPPAPSR